jgi:23S rRNA (pseudouridine1915-N3)-methyltransferase
MEVKPEPRGEAIPVERLTEAEARRIRAALPAGSFKVVLDERGRGCTTRELSQRLESWQMEGRDVAFLIGGADGLAPGLSREADWLWSLSPLTLPHGLARVVVAEQLYRAWSITKNHPYHRD